IVRETANFLQAELGKVTSGDIETKSLNSLVSYVDKTAERQLVAKLSALLPHSVFLTEEETVAQEAGEYRWIIDPLDGTTNFLHQVPIFAVSVALQQNERTILGVIYEVNRAECFYAWKGGGAFLDGNPIRVSLTKTLSESLLATGFPYYDFKWIDPYLAAFRHFIQNTRGVRRCGAAAVDLAYVAAGRFDGFYEYSLSAWDMAAGVLIIQEAGGKVSDFFGGDDYLFGKHIIVGNPFIFAKIRAVIEEKFSDFE
ncbi:MAG: inositol monophosphatase family protein, partial [Bacteroidota bacterium]